MKPIFLIGYMGCGKTTLGQALAHRTGLRFVDLDTMIEERCSMSVNDIFASRGEDGFRQIERELLAEVASMDDVVVACGGGTPCQEGNMELMNSRGTTVWLRASDAALFRRLSIARAERPLIAALTDDDSLRRHIADHQRGRLPYYSRARFTFCSDYLESEEEISDSVDSFLKLITIT